MSNKLMTLKEAVSKYVKSGDTLFVGGAQHATPQAALHEIVRQKIDHLGVVAVLAQPTLLIGEGLVDKMITGYAAQDYTASYPLGKAKAMNRFPVYEEYSHFGISLALFAGYMGIPFIPTKGHLGSDMPKYNKNIKSIDCPFTGGKVAAIKAVVPDVAVIHVQRADAEGNAQKWGSIGVDVEGINASRKVIVTAETIVSSDVIRRDPNRTIIPGFRVSAVVEQPWGAFPSRLAGFYNADRGGFMRVAIAGGNEQTYEDYLRDFVYGVKDWNEYIEKVKSIKGADYFDKARLKNPVKSEPIITGS
ncbi:MAG: CoA transferase subunit A [Chloroflexi bacterium]|nr:CoA transferase subunit A [Chloroflexota bacterium]